MFPASTHALPEAMEADLLTVLHITSLDLHINPNTQTHNTHKYACTKPREVGEVKEEAELVVRRGQKFKVTLTFDRPYDKARDDLRIALKTGMTNYKQPFKCVKEL